MRKLIIFFTAHTILSWIEKNKKKVFRKPNPGMVLKAIKMYNINIGNSFMIVIKKLMKYVLKDQK